MSIVDDIKFSGDGLVPAITQDHETGEVLMMAYMNREALEKTLDSGKVHYYSRSRKKLWMKGESSGHVQEVKGIFLDCDNDSLLIKVVQNVAACHTGHYSCFYREVAEGKLVEVSDKTFDEGKVYGD